MNQVDELFGIVSHMAVLGKHHTVDMILGLNVHKDILDHLYLFWIQPKKRLFGQLDLEEEDLKEVTDPLTLTARAVF